ncbi:hypothetical protein NDU88_005085 [Pleurodeles waltl]|uniref:Reverse transcriptase domain-containing protein n=1 Tax=Pleurodeles waltl TaxID=8319 RepID=A0AAV7WX94_PLEWA|nr:hypothetical protein NDU88_005085 [Pleurodeles waltl]
MAPRTHTDSHTALKDATRRHHQLLRLAKRSSFETHLVNNAHNSKEFFNIVKELSNPSAIVNDIPPSQELRDALATSFLRKIIDIHDSFNTPTTPTTPISSSTNSTRTNRLTSWTNINDDETRKTMNSIHSGSPSDPCPHHIYNKADTAIAPQLRKVINISFETARFPESWKHAEIHTLLKKPKADPKDLKNFRPISLLPFPAKVIEKIINTQLIRHLEDNNILDPSQSGFRWNHSTETALLAATDDIRSQLDNGKTSALILLDLSAAFDTVHHYTLKIHLHEAGIQKKAHRLDHILPLRQNPESLPPSLLIRSHQHHLRCTPGFIPQPDAVQYLHGPPRTSGPPTQPQHHLLR